MKASILNQSDFIGEGTGEGNLSDSSPVSATCVARRTHDFAYRCGDCGVGRRILCFRASSCRSTVSGTNPLSHSNRGLTFEGVGVLANGPFSMQFPMKGRIVEYRLEFLVPWLIPLENCL